MTSQSDSWSAESGAPEWDALARYVSGESTAAEAAHVRDWLDAHPAARESLDTIHVATSAFPAPEVDVDAALARVHERMRTERSDVAAARSLPGGRWLAGLAALAVAAGVVALVVTRVARGTPAGGAAVIAASARTYATPVGQRDSILLADGSRIVLGPASRLTVQAGYGGTARAVQLQGDAYFAVRHDPRVPFTVRVDDAVIQDLGTQFTVESDAAAGTKVAVLAGSVRLRASGAPVSAAVVLRAGDSGSLDAAGAARVTPGGATGADTAWTSGRLVFEDASLVRVAGELWRWYGIDLVVNDTALRDRHLTAAFAGEPVDEVLRTIAVTLGARVEQHGDTAVLSASAHAAPETR